MRGKDMMPPLSWINGYLSDITGQIVLAQFLEWLGRPGNFDYTLVPPRVFPATAPDLGELPAELHPRVAGLLATAGVQSLYSHQAEAIGLALAGKNVVLSTPTASGKTLAYQVPVLDALVRDPQARSLFLFPLKALERDQRDSFLALARDSGLDAAVYDGDTPETERRKIRNRPPRVVITNPDMLHVSLLPYHDTWKELFGHLAYFVLDEVHTYKGIFGSHIRQVILRTLRVCAVHGSNPRFITSSATIANPGKLVSTLIGDEVSVVDRSGAPTAERQFVFLNPVLSPYTVASRLFAKAVQLGLKTIVFTRARKITELITTWVLQESPQLRGRISSYRAGFLPEERREIEAQLFSGKMDGVISTSALEMGIDVGGLDLCILVGYPGTIINTWQRGGRVGRGDRPSAIVLIAGNDALDQYFIRNPDDFFGRNCEEAILDPMNREVLKRHIPCAAAETPLSADEPWAANEEVQSVVQELERDGSIYLGADGAWHCSSRWPQRGVDLRSIGPSFSIVLEDGKTMVGSASGTRVFTDCHVGAVYLHRARQYVVTKLDLQRQNAFVRAERVNYYTRALSEKDTEILGAPIRSAEFPGYWIREARLKVTQRIVGYEKRRTSGQELIGTVDLDLPPLHFETVGIWIEIPDKVKEAVQKMGLHFMGGIHAMEHAAISMFPLFALCDRDDVGGISTPEHPQVCRAAVFIYDGHAGGVGLAHRAFDVIEDLLEKTRFLVKKCPCDTGCPSCIHSPKCGSGNKPLDKKACLATLEFLMHPEKAESVLNPKESEDSKGSAIPIKKKRRPSSRTAAGPPEPRSPRARIFPDLQEPPMKSLPIQHADRDAPRIVVFDLETQKLADEVGGWRHVAKMGLALAVIHTEQDGFRTFTEDAVADLITALKDADLVVGFNQLRFDYEVLAAYTHETLRNLPNLDILAEVEAALGFRLSLDHLAGCTLGAKKSGSGLDAVKWFREGKMDLLEQYCRDDVRLTRDLYRFGCENGYLRYKRKDRSMANISVNWCSGLTVRP
ncbi:MAG: DEAD/DEAH box helicase [Desulfomonile tiedjei]|nr:DEAD/DEAH box helicase [Desulfomonile tiedjei]